MVHCLLITQDDGLTRSLLTASGRGALTEAVSWHIAKTREEWVESLAKRRFDLVAGDLSCPEFDPMGAIQQIEGRPQKPLLAVLAPGDQLTAAAAIFEHLALEVFPREHPKALMLVCEAIRRQQGSSEQLNEANISLQEQKWYTHHAEQVGQIGSWTCGLGDGAALVWSEGTYRIFGVQKGEFAGTVQAFMEFVHQDDRESVKRSVNEAIRANTVYATEHRILRRDGAVRWVHERGSLIQDPNTGEPRLIGVVRDITERQVIYEKLREQAALLDMPQSAIFTHDLHGRIRFWNKGAEQLYGWTRAEAVGLNIADLLYAFQPGRFDKIMRDVTERDQWESELRQLTREGRELVCDCRCSVIRDASQQPKLILAVNTDLTERKRMEQQFLRAQRMECVGALASGVAHDLNNVLTPILMTMPLFQAKLTDAEDQELIANLETSARRGAEIVKQVLAFARGQDGQRLPMRLEPLIKEITRMVRETFPRTIIVETSLGDSLHLVKADATQVYQILMNLCVNARDAMPEGGRLHISAENTLLRSTEAMHGGDVAPPGPYVRLSVLDTGTGIPDAVLAQMFEPFFTTKGPNQGTGLGLGTVLKLVKGHGGFLKVSTRVNEGTEMVIMLPAALDGIPIPVSNETVEYRGGDGQTILVVDDEATIRYVTRSALEEHGYRIMTAGDGNEALAVFESHRNVIRAALVDLLMPSLDGTSTINRMLQIDPSIPIIAITGMLDQNRNGSALPELPKGVLRLQKPFTAEMLLVTLDKVLHDGIAV